jgi:predicted ATPase/DNA-binding XRE family transcriptional regulator
MDHPEPLTLALALQQLRTARGWTQEELAERSSVSIRTISDIERGVSRYPHRDTLRLLGAALELTEDEAALLRPGRYAHAAHQVAGPASGELPADGSPSAATPLIGRANELRALQAALTEDHDRLITLTGPGGIGKTRLALEMISTGAPESFEDVTFVDLALVANAAYVPSAVAHALGIRERADQPLSETLRAELGDKRLLLILDNFEHVLEARALLSQLLEHCQNVRLLVTSRHPVEIPGERVVTLPPLALPDSRRPISTDLALSAPATMLFIERAASAQPGFAVTPAVARAIARICTRLGGIPLAIELAAAWSDRLAPQEILLQLSSASGRGLLSLLTRRADAGAARQRSMRDAVAWSYHLLDGHEQVVFRRLGVFVGSWSVEAAEAICGATRPATATRNAALRLDEQRDPSDQLDQIDQDDSLAALTQLVHHSLMFATPSGDDSVRFSMHTTIASYAQTLLDERKERASLARRHAEYFTGLVERLEQELTGPQQRQSLMRLIDEYGNIRAALRWTREHHEIDLGLRLAGALWWFWETRGYGTEGREWVEGMLALAEAPGTLVRDESLARALYCATILAAGRHDYARAEQFGRAFFAKTNQPAKRARALLTLGNIAKFRGDLAQADQLYSDGLALLRELGDTRGALVALNNLSAMLIERGDLDRALPLIEESLSLKRQAGDRRGIAVSLINLGELQRLKGNMAAAQQTLEESLQIFQDLEDRQGTTVAQSSLGELAYAQEDFAQAAERFSASLSLYQRMEDTAGEAQALQHLGRTYARLGDAQQAEEYLRASAARFEAQNQIAHMLESLVMLAGVAWEHGQRPLAEQALSVVREHLNRPPGASGSHVALSPAAQADYARLLADIPDPSEAARRAEEAEEQEGA